MRFAIDLLTEATDTSHAAVESFLSNWSVRAFLPYANTSKHAGKYLASHECSFVWAMYAIIDRVVV